MKRKGINRGGFFAVSFLSGKLHEHFETEEAAWSWVKEHKLCGECLKELEAGGAHLENAETSETDWIAIEHPADTLCGSEWMVLSTEEAEALQTYAPAAEALGNLPDFPLDTVPDVSLESLMRSARRPLSSSARFLGAFFDWLDMSKGIRSLSGCKRMRTLNSWSAECPDCGQIYLLAPATPLEA